MIFVGIKIMDVGDCSVTESVSDKATSDSHLEFPPNFQPESGGQSILSLI